MSTTVCVSADTLGYPEGGGHLWVYLNWALGLKSLGCRVVWLEGVEATTPPDVVRRRVAQLQGRLEHYGLTDGLALCPRTDADLPPRRSPSALDLEVAAAADLLLNFRYDTPRDVVKRFRRSALIDIDPGLLQVWMTIGQVRVAEHDVYFSIGETVGRPGERFPDAGRTWHYTPPCVALDWWPTHAAAPDAPFTTVSHWYAEEWMWEGAEVYRNDKRSGFLPFLDLPRHTGQPLELALCLGLDEGEPTELLEKGWRVRHSYTVASTPWDYQRYLQASRGEFSCAKPSCLRLANAWVSDRTLCYLASGKPAVVQHTGPSRFLPDAAGLFRFHDLEGAAQCLDRAADDSAHQGRLARALVQEYFDARKVAAKVLERALA